MCRISCQLRGGLTHANWRNRIAGLQMRVHETLHGYSPVIYGEYVVKRCIATASMGTVTEDLERLQSIQADLGALQTNVLNTFGAGVHFGDTEKLLSRIREAIGYLQSIEIAPLEQRPLIHVLGELVARRKVLEHHAAVAQCYQ